ncbi:ParB N-terminal domain-containing protein [Leptolyngbya sp. PL-A3]|uniref:ParB N-terminal domain-containing protein n=1 Tax=Leptolyngbya sp. PL-A3 TaxID=2933911 RepID=UPI003297F85C
MNDQKGKYGSLIRKARQLDDQEPAAEQLAIRESSIALDQIMERTVSTRLLSSEHVQSLAESIAVIGLIEPLAVDEKGRLLAGGHRLAAIRYLKEANPDAYTQNFEGDRIPVRVMPFDAEVAPDLALQVEVAENEQRRDYTVAEVKALAERLKAAGYIDRKGRPSKGEKPLLPALEVIVGKSMSTLKRYLQEEPQTPKSENSSNELFSQKRHLKQAYKALEKWQQGTEGRDLTIQEEKLLKQLPAFLKMVERLSE